MGHKTLIGGTAYEISGGKTLVGGTAYSIDKGKTMVGGTAYEIAFSSPVTVSWSGKFDSTYSYVTVNGTKYTNAGSGTYEQPPSISVRVNSSTSKSRCYVKLNGTTVQDGSGAYTFTPDPGSTVTIKMTYSNDSYKYYYATITTS